MPLLRGVFYHIKQTPNIPQLNEACGSHRQRLYQKRYLEAAAEYGFEEAMQSTWVCKCICCDVAGWGSGTSKTKAKKEAAYQVLKKLFASLDQIQN